MQEATSASPSVFSLKIYYFSVLRSAGEKKKNLAVVNKGKKKKSQCLEKKSSLIESESTSASSWMSKGVIGDWLQIMNNYIKVGSLLLVRVSICVCARMRACVCARVALSLCTPRGSCMCLPACVCFCNRCRGVCVCSLLRQSLTVCVCVCGCVWVRVWAARCVQGMFWMRKKPAGAISDSQPAPVSWIQSVLLFLLSQWFETNIQLSIMR